MRITIIGELAFQSSPFAAIDADLFQRWLQQKNGAVKETRSPVAVAAPLDGQDQTVTTLPTTIPVTPLQRNSTLAAHFVETPREIDIDSEIRQFEKHATPATLVRSSSASAPSSLRHPPRAKQQQQQHMMTPSMKRIVSSVRGETTLDGDDDSERQLQAACHRLLRALDNEHSDTTMASGGWMEVLVSAMNALADDAVLVGV